MSQPSKDTNRIEEAAEKAGEAFWSVIVEHFPEAEFGDFDMDCDTPMTEWVTRWVHLNADTEDLYAVQFRSMQSAIHNIAVFDDENEAASFFDYIITHEELPEVDDSTYNGLIGFNEINFRQPPTQFNDAELIYVNEPTNLIPDVYEY